MTPEQKFMNTAIDATIFLLEERMENYTKIDEGRDYTYLYDFVSILKDDLLALKK